MARENNRKFRNIDHSFFICKNVPLRSIFPDWRFFWPIFFQDFLAQALGREKPTCCIEVNITFPVVVGVDGENNIEL